MNKLLKNANECEDEFIKLAIERSESDHADELKKAKRTLRQNEKRIAELNKLFTQLYEDNVAGKITDELFSMMFKSYEAEQSNLKENSEALPLLSRKRAEKRGYFSIRQYCEKI